MNAPSTSAGLGSGAPASSHPLLRRAAERAVLAPSIHNTQPWWFVIRGSSLEIWADVSRQLSVLDPRKRQLMISCGCALFNARVVIAAGGYTAKVERFPDPARPHLVARLEIGPRAVDPSGIAGLDDVIEQRHTNRREFLDHRVPADVVYDLVRAARDEGAVLLPVTRTEHALTIARLTREAAELEHNDPSYQSELRAWTTDDPHRVDGVQLASVPLAGPDSAVAEDLPLRVFDLDGTGWLPSQSHSGPDQCLLVLGSDQDDPLQWVQVGESLQRVWLELTQLGFALTPLTQVVEVKRTYAALRTKLRLQMYPGVLLRVGRAAQAEQSRRRPLEDLISDLD